MYRNQKEPRTESDLLTHSFNVIMEVIIKPKIVLTWITLSKWYI